MTTDLIIQVNVTTTTTTGNRGNMYGGVDVRAAALSVEFSTSCVSYSRYVPIPGTWYHTIYY